MAKHTEDERVDATTDQIKREIEQARERISETTTQLGERIRATFDWRQQVGEHPWASVGVAAGAGFVIGAAIARAIGRGRAAGSYGETYTYDRIGRDVEAQVPGTAAGAEWLRGQTGAGTAAPDEAWRPSRDSAWSPEVEGRSARPSGGTGRSGALAGLVASVGAALEPQLKEIGRTLAEQLKDLSNDLIGQGKEAMKSKVDRWRQGSSREPADPSAGSAGWQSPAAGGSTLSSESAGTWASDRPAASREGTSAERRMGG